MASEITEQKREESGKHPREEEHKETCEPPLKKLSVGSSVSDENPGDGASHGINKEFESESVLDKSLHSEPALTDSMIEQMCDRYGLVYVDGSCVPGPYYEQKSRAIVESEFKDCDELCDWRKCYGIARNQAVYYVWLTDRSWDDSECKLILKENGCRKSCFLRRSKACESLFYAALDDKQAAKLRDCNEVVSMAPESEMFCEN